MSRTKNILDDISPDALNEAPERLSEAAKMQRVWDTYDGLSGVTPVAGNPNFMGVSLFHIDGEHGKASCSVTSDGQVINGKGIA